MKKVNKKISKDELKVVFLLDETGSMEPKRDEAISSFNKYISDLKKEKNAGSVKFSLVLFNTMRKVRIIDDVAINKVPKLDRAKYVPNSMTNLYDAIGSELSRYKSGKVLYVILTDGEENSSREYTQEQVRNMIGDLEKKGCEFMYLGQGVDKWSGISMGIARSSSVKTFAGGMSAARTTTAQFMNGRGRLTSTTNIINRGGV